VIIGRVYGGHPRVVLSIAGLDLEFILDTGFEGDLALSTHLADVVCGPVVAVENRRLADGRRLRVPIRGAELDWQGDLRPVQVLVLEGDPLLGSALLMGQYLHIEMIEGGEVVIEPM
jgi:predicted aspartyl protease